MHTNRPVARLLATTIGAGALLLTAACGGGAGGSGDTEIVFWTHTHPPMVDLNKKLISEYEEANPGVTIKYETIPNNEFGTKMLTALSSGGGPDVINMDDSALRGEYIPKGLVAPLDPAAFEKESTDQVREDYLEGTLDGASDAEGELYGVPSEFNATAFAINTEHFADAGLDPAAPPQTWDEVAEYGQKLVAAGHQGFNFIYLHSGWYTQQYQTLLNQTGGSIVNEDATQSRVLEPESVEALTIWNDLINKHKVGDANTSSREATSPFEDFSAGKQSMAIVYPWAVDQIAKDNPETFENMEVVPLPQADQADPAGRWYGYYLAVNAASKEQEESWKFVNFLASHPDEWISDAQFVQPVQDWEEGEAASEIPFVDVWSKAYTEGQFDEVGPHWSEVQDAIKAAVERTIFDQMPPEESLKIADEEINRSLQN